MNTFYYDVNRLMVMKSKYLNGVGYFLKEISKGFHGIGLLGPLHLIAL